MSTKKFWAILGVAALASASKHTPEFIKAAGMQSLTGGVDQLISEWFTDEMREDILAKIEEVQASGEDGPDAMLDIAAFAASRFVRDVQTKFGIGDVMELDIDMSGLIQHMAELLKPLLEE